MSTTLQCAECSHTEPHWIGDHVKDAHGISVEEYLAKHPGVPVASQALMDLRAKEIQTVRRSLPPAPEDLEISFAGVTFPVNTDVDASSCLPEPPHYRLPSHGELAADVGHALVSLYRGRSLYVWGLPGSGKDALFHAFSSRTRTPAIIKQVIPGTDIESWFFSRGFNEQGTVWEEGDVLCALRDGYLTSKGRRVPYLLLVSDLDRADRAQAEYLRLITDSIQGRVSGPTGRVYDILPGTRVVATANTAGSGDSRGRMVSANPIDASILDRFERKIQFHWLSWKDEEPVVREKFPVLAKQAPWVFDQMGRITVKLREAIHNDSLYAEFSHRGLCSILGHAEDLIQCGWGRNATPPARLLKVASRVWLDGLPDQDTYNEACQIMDPYLEGGMMDSAGPISDEDLATF